MLVASVAVLLERLENDLFQLQRKVRIYLGRRWRRILLEDGAEDDRRRRSTESWPAAGHFIEDRAEAEKVGARVHILAPRLLGRHVGHGTHRHTWPGELFGVDRCCGRVLARKRGRPARYGTGILPVFSICPGARRPSYSRRDAGATSQLGQAEIEYLRLPTLGHEDIRWLNVAVDDAFGVRGVEPVGNLNRQIQQRVDP